MLAFLSFIFLLTQYAHAFSGSRSGLTRVNRPSTRLASTLVTLYEEVTVPTLKGVSLVDITKGTSEI